MFSKLINYALFSLLVGWVGGIQADNQTPDLSPIFPETELPFRVAIELADFMLPNGIHSFASATYRGKWLFMAGRTNGLHGFGAGPDNFPPLEQNKVVYVVDPISKQVFFRDLRDPGSGLTPTQIDLLSVTSPQFYQAEETLYVVGGYGVDSLTGQFTTKASLSAIDIPGLIHWVTHPCQHETAAQHIRQIFHPVFQVTGGVMAQVGHHSTLLMFGQNFTGFYDPSSNGEYTEQVRKFRIIDKKDQLKVVVKPSIPVIPDINYRRRDLNIVPIIKKDHRGKLKSAFVAYAGVFTPSGGVWTVPVEITDRGVPTMANPADPSTFKQAMNHYTCADIGLFSKKTGDMYTVLLGGISLGFFANGQFQTDSEVPFINQVTTIKRDKQGNYQQYFMRAQYPLILSTLVNPGNPLLFGAGSLFIPVDHLPMYENGVLKLDSLGGEPVLLGYIIGGIQSTLPNTNTRFDSSASPYIFRVILTPVCHHD
jgi:hypothetical protein